jgi:hypothetical protein
MTSYEFFARAFLAALPEVFAGLAANESFNGLPTPDQVELLSTALMPTGVFAIEAMKMFETLIEIKRLRELPTRSLSLVSLRERGVQDCRRPLLSRATTPERIRYWSPTGLLECGKKAEHGRCAPVARSTPSLHCWYVCCNQLSSRFSTQPPPSPESC